MSNPASLPDETDADIAARAARDAVDAALAHRTHEQRDAFWNAIDLYYSARRHPGANEVKLAATKE